jgi:hypothetical protein
VPRRKKKHAIEQTTDEAMERLFGRKVRDKLKEYVREQDEETKKSDTYGKKSPHK